MVASAAPSPIVSAPLLAISALPALAQMRSLLSPSVAIQLLPPVATMVSAWLALTM